MKLLLMEETLKLLKLTEIKLKNLIQLGMPHLKIGNDLRFIESEIVPWHKVNCPTQEELEKKFIDRSGRSIDQYIKINELASILRVEKTKIYNLYQSGGMPSQLVGRRRFFNLDDIISFFRKGETITQPPDQPKKQKPVLFVVDGSHSPMKNKAGAGVLMKNKDQVTGYSFGLGNHKIMLAEMMAIYHAMQLTKENGFEHAIIATDQMGFINSRDRKKYIDNALSKAPSSIKESMTNLICELNHRVTFVYYKNIKNQYGFTDVLYHNAHALSRRYVDSVIEGEKLDVMHVSQCDTLSMNSLNTLLNEGGQTLNIEFDKVSGIYAYFNVSINGKTKSIKSNSNTPVKAALEIANQLIASTKQQVNLSIKKIPNFAEDMKKLFNPTRFSIPQKVKKLFENLKEKTTLSMEDPFEPYIHEYMQQRAAS